MNLFQQRQVIVAGVVAIFVVSTAAIALAEPRVEMELATMRGLAPTAPHEWITTLKDLDNVNFRIRAAESGDEPQVSTTGSGASLVYRVTGIITAGNTLRLPGGTFRTSDKRAIAAWIAKLRQGGDENLTAKTGAFGLTSKQFVSLHEALATRVTFSTRGVPAKTVVQKIVSLIRPEVAIDPASEAAFREGGELTDELQGLSAGTALAAALRPLGLVLVPERGRGDDVQLVIIDVRRVEKSWPVGWPTEKNTADTIPALLKFLNVEINDTPLSEALAAIQQRLEVPFLFDQNSIARQRIDLEKTRVSLPAGNTWYAKILDRLLSQAKMNWEIRIDEAERPFLWISTKIK